MAQPFNNTAISTFFQGNGTYNNGLTSTNLSGMRRRRLSGMGAASTSPTDGAGNYIPVAQTASGSSLQTTAAAAASLVNSAKGAITGALQAEAAQNAINAQKNFTQALTPGMITLLIGVVAYALVFKDKR